MHQRTINGFTQYLPFNRSFVQPIITSKNIEIINKNIELFYLNSTASTTYPSIA